MTIPTLASIDEAIAEGGDTRLLTGTGFDSSATVWLRDTTSGEYVGKGYVFDTDYDVTPTTLYFGVPRWRLDGTALAVGTYDVQVITDGGGSNLLLDGVDLRVVADKSKLLNMIRKWSRAWASFADAAAGPALDPPTFHPLQLPGVEFLMLAGESTLRVDATDGSLIDSLSDLAQADTWQPPGADKPLVAFDETGRRVMRITGDADLYYGGAATPHTYPGNMMWWAVVRAYGNPGATFRIYDGNNLVGMRLLSGGATRGDWFGTALNGTTVISDMGATSLVTHGEDAAAIDLLFDNVSEATGTGGAFAALDTPKVDTNGTLTGVIDVHAVGVFDGDQLKSADYDRLQAYVEDSFVETGKEPMDFAPVALWRADSYTLDASGNVSQLHDLTGGGYHMTQATPAERSPLGVDSNDVAFVDFSQGVGNMSAATVVIPAEPMLWMVVELVAKNADRQFFSTGIAANNIQLGQWASTGGPDGSIGNQRVNASTPDLSATGPVAMAMVANTWPDGDLYLNNALVGSTSGSTGTVQTPETVYLAARYDGAAWSRIRVYEAAIFDASAMSAQDLADLQAYAVRRYGV